MTCFWTDTVTHLSHVSPGSYSSIATSSSSRLSNRIAVCISGAARTFSDDLSFSTIQAAFSTFPDIDFDFFCWLSNDPGKSDRNSKNHSYPSVSNGIVRSKASLLSRSSPYGTFVLNEVNFETSPMCDFGNYGKDLIDKSDEDVVTRTTQPLFKREKCFELILAAEEQIQIEYGSEWRYTTVVSLRPDMFFFGPLSRQALLTPIPLFPVPAHGSSITYPNGHIPNDHIVFLPRNHSELYFRMGRQFRECQGKFEGPLGLQLIVNLIIHTFPYASIDTETVVPYNLNRLGTPEGPCTRINFFKSNLNSKHNSLDRLLQQCETFVAWFVSTSFEKGKIQEYIIDFWNESEMP